MGRIIWRRKIMEVILLLHNDGKLADWCDDLLNEQEENKA